MQVILRPAAAADIEDAISWYERQRPALGGQFLEAVNAVLTQIAENPRLAALPYKYLEYGSYLADWRRRLAIKMWSGWPTYPMVFVKGQLVGGASELEKLLAQPGWRP
jgi:plasmid stabilization system protein ParE